MRILLIHQNYPGQFRQLIPLLLREGYELRAICAHKRQLPSEVPVLRYEEPDLGGLASASINAPGLDYWADGLARAPKVAWCAEQWRRDGWAPDLILGHSGWGETLLLHQVWPKCPSILWPELWVKPQHAGIELSPQGPGPTLQQLADHSARNHLTRAALASAQAWVMPTQYQAESLPAEFQDSRLHVIHEGINCDVACPRDDVEYHVRGIRVDRSVPTVTFVNRNLESLRGFDVFMRALPKILQGHKDVRILIVGDNGAGYAGSRGEEAPLKQRMLSELDGQLDLERIHFLGRIPYPTLLALLQASWVHVYLTKPFILGWSLLEAMSCGCALVGSEGMPVSEVLTDRHNALLVPGGDSSAVAASVLDLLSNSSLRLSLGEQARRDAMSWDQSVMWPRFKSLFETLVNS